MGAFAGNRTSRNAGGDDDTGVRKIGDAQQILSAAIFDSCRIERAWGTSCERSFVYIVGANKSVSTVDIASLPLFTILTITFALVTLFSCWTGRVFASIIVTGDNKKRKKSAKQHHEGNRRK